MAQIPDDDVAWYLDYLRDDERKIGQRAAVVHRLRLQAT